MKKSLVVLSLWIGISLLGMEAAYRRGVEAMLEKANGGHGVWSAEYGIGVLRHHGGAAGEAAALTKNRGFARRPAGGGLRRRDGCAVEFGKCARRLGCGGGRVFRDVGDAFGYGMSFGVGTAARCMRARMEVAGGAYVGR